MRKILFTVFILLAALLFAANGLNPLRLHIIANSNSREDQQLKLEIRDYILQEKNDLLKNCKDKQQAQQIISANAESLENLANEVLEGSHLEKKADEWNYIFLHDDIVLFGAKVAKKQCNTIANSSTCGAICRLSGG